MGVLRDGKQPLRFNNTRKTQRFNERNYCVIQARILPQTEPYCRASFLIEIIVSKEYLFKLSEVIFPHPVCHSSVDEGGCHYHPTLCLV
jgi:hypothetical protein